MITSATKATQLTNPTSIQKSNHQNKVAPTQSEIKWAQSLESKIHNDSYKATPQEIERYTDIYNRHQKSQASEQAQTKHPKATNQDKVSLGESLIKGAKVAVPVLAGFAGGSLMGMASVSGAANAASYFKGIALIGGVPGAVGAGVSLAVGKDHKVMAGLGSGAITGIAIGLLSKNPAAAIVTGMIGAAAGGFGAIGAQHIQSMMK